MVQKWGIFVHDPEGDMGAGCIVGPYRTVGRAEGRAEVIRRAAALDGWEIETIILPVVSGDESPRAIVGRFDR
jgi:hypothetical protein